MKRSAAETPGVSLFPFLAVLLCTMGALIVVLVVINRQAQRHAAYRDADATAARRTLELDREELELQVGQLTAARQKTLDDLDKARRHLSSLEDQSRQWTDQLDRLKESARLLAADDRVQQREALRAELGKLNAQRRQLDEEIANARKAAAEKPSFAIIPYDGMYQTSRRPIYIECRGDAVILQPEGIVFTPNDFLGPPGPGNPLASALRAAREYWSSVPPVAPGVPTEPYPLLLVRPDGIIAYYLVRDAMASWASEFGYELVDDDWKLEYPTPNDPRLADMETRAVAEARERLKWLAEVSPEMFVRKSKTQYRVSSIKGGLVRDDGPSLGHDPFADDPLGGFGRTGNSAVPSVSGRPGYGPGNGLNNIAGSGTRGGLGNGLHGDGLSNGNSLNQGGGLNYGDGLNSNGLNNGLGGRSDPRGNGLNHGAGDQLASSGYGSNPTTGPMGASSFAPGGGEVGKNGAANGDMNDGTGGGVNGEFKNELNGGTSSASNAYGATSNTAAYRGGSTSDVFGPPGTYGPSSASSSGSPSGSSNSFASSGGTGPSSAGGSAGQMSGSSSSASSMVSQAGGGDSSSSEMSAGMPSPTLNFQQQQRTADRSVADTRGRNWALPDREASSVPITRPIRVECRADRLVIVPDVRNQEAQVAPFAGHTGEAVDHLVAAVRAHTQTWGMAGRGMYWKPQLVLDVDPAAEARAADLQLLLANSGLDVKRK